LVPSNRKRKKGLKKAEPSAGAAAGRIYAFTAFRIVTDTGGAGAVGVRRHGLSAIDRLLPVGPMIPEFTDRLKGQSDC
jgi:hypothetical protein